MKRVFIHIGLAKTATSFLQGVVFPALCDVRYVSIKEDYFQDLFAKMFRQKLSPNEKKILTDKIQDYPSQNPLLISSEGFSGNMFGLGVKSRDEIFQELKEVFQEVDVKIIVGIRSQTSLFSSLYKQYIHEGGTKSMSNFLKELGADFTNPANRFLSLYKYSLLLATLEKEFSKENIYIYLFEDLRENQAVFMSKLYSFLGETTRFDASDKVYNRGYGARQIALAKSWNKIFKSDFNKNGFLPQLRIPGIGKIGPRLFLQNRFSQKLLYTPYNIPSSIKREIQSYYHKDNKIVEKKYNLKL